MTDFWTRSKKLNSIELINSDPLLSEFKHHFILLKVYLPRKMSLQAFAQKIPEGFGLKSQLYNSVYISQLVNVYQGDLVDIAIGFRRDQTAIQIAKRLLQFKLDGRISYVQLSNGFKFFMDELQKQQQQDRIRQDFSIQNFHTKAKQSQPISKINQNTQIHQNSLKSKGKQQKMINQFKQTPVQQSQSKSRSRSRSGGSRSRDKVKKQIFQRISSDFEGGQASRKPNQIQSRLESKHKSSKN